MGKRRTAEQIQRLLREADRDLAKGLTRRRRLPQARHQREHLLPLATTASTSARSMTPAASRTRRPRSTASSSWSPSCSWTRRCSRTSPKKSGDPQPATGRGRLPAETYRGLAAEGQPGAGPGALDAALPPRDRAATSRLIRAIRRLARKHPRWGYRRIHARLEQQGWTVNLKRVHRLWRELGLQRPVRRASRKKAGPEARDERQQLRQPAGAVQERRLDLRLRGRSDGRGRPLKWLTLVDEYTRECLALHVDRSLTGTDVRRCWPG